MNSKDFYLILGKKSGAFKYSSNKWMIALTTSRTYGKFSK